MIPLAGRRITLVGGAGFIGNHLALALKAQGAEVSVVDNLMVNNLMSFISSENCAVNKDWYLSFLGGRIEALRKVGIPLYIQDARDYHALTKVLKSLSPQVVVHLAAVAHANLSNKDPYSTFDHSFRTLENCLDYSRNNIEHFIYFSSSMVYGNFKDGLVDEESPCDPIGIYGSLKFGGEKLVIAYQQAFDMPYTIIRPSALYGESCVSNRVGQIFIEKAIKGQEITIQGDGSDRLDFTYIQDLVNGATRVITHKKAHNQIFNLTYGESRSLEDVVSIVRQHFPEISVSYVKKDKLTPKRGTLSVEKARRLIGYDPAWPIEKGFARYIEWYKELSCGREGGISSVTD